MEAWDPHKSVRPTPQPAGCDPEDALGLAGTLTQCPFWPEGTPYPAAGLPA